MMTKKVPGTPFKKGDPRINRKGRPKDFNALRELTQSIAHKIATGKDGPMVVDGHIVTVTEAILRQWASSKNPKLQMAFLEYAYGKPSVEVQHSGELEVKVKGYAIVSPADWKK